MRLFYSNIGKKLEFGEDYYIEYDYSKKNDNYKSSINFGNNKSRLIEKINKLRSEGYIGYYEKYEY